MTQDQLRELFRSYGDDYNKFGRVTAPRSRRPDLHAFMLLDELLPVAEGGGRDMVSAAEHDEIYLSVDTEALAAVITAEQVMELVRCGVRYDRQYDSLVMFV